MTVSQVNQNSLLDPTLHRHSSQGHALGWRVGQKLSLAVLEQAGSGRYWVGLGGVRQLVESLVQLREGDLIRTEVVAVGERLELRYMGLVTASQGSADSPVQEHTGHHRQRLVDRLADSRGVPLSAEQRGSLSAFVDESRDPEAMALGGMYLLQLGLPLDRSSMTALESAQIDPPAVADPTEAGDLAVLADRLLSGDDAAIDEGRDLLDRALDPGKGEPTPSIDQEHAVPGLGQSEARDTGKPAAREFVHWLLNQHDGGSAGYRYGSVPVLVGDELVELDVVYFHHRRPGAEQTPLQRLVMTLQTEAFGRVEVLAEAIDRRLLIRFSGDNPAAAELVDRVADIRQLVERLGWQVDSVGYDIGRSPQRGARQIIEHVLAGDHFERIL